MSWFWILLLVAFTGIGFSECSRHHLRHSAIITGTIHCNTCFLENFHKQSHFIAGASVEVRCKGVTSRLSFRQQVKTDSHGEFIVHLPPSIGKHVNRIKNCSVLLISSNEPHCTAPASVESSSLCLESKGQGTRIFLAGFFMFKPMKQPDVCDQKPSIDQPEEPHTVEDHSVFPSPPSLLGGLLPPLPGLPSLPPLPRLPPLPEFPPLPELPHLPPLPVSLLPPPRKDLPAKVPHITESEVDHSQGFPFPPIFPTPSPPPHFQLPPIPSLTPALPLPQPALPPFPFQPIPGFPGIPPV